MHQGHERPAVSLAKKLYSHRDQNTSLASLIDKKNLLFSSKQTINNLESQPFQNTNSSPFIKRLNSNFSIDKDSAERLFNNKDEELSPIRQDSRGFFRDIKARETSSKSPDFNINDSPYNRQEDESPKRNKFFPAKRSTTDIPLDSKSTENPSSTAYDRTPTTRAEGLSARTLFPFQKVPPFKKPQSISVFKSDRDNRLFSTPEWDSEISLTASEQRFDEEIPMKESLLLTDENMSPSSSPKRNDNSRSMRQGGFWGKDTGKLVEPASGSKIDCMKLKKFLFEMEDPSENNVLRTAKTAAKTEITEETTRRSVYSYNPYMNTGNILTESSMQDISDLYKGKKLSNASKILQEKQQSNEMGTMAIKKLEKKQGSLRNGLALANRSKAKGNILQNKVFLFINALRLIKRRLKAIYLKNRFEVYKYNPKEDPPVRRIVKRNKHLIKRRNAYTKEDNKFKEQSSLEVQEGVRVDVFDFTGYSSIFNAKEILKVPAGSNDIRLGRTVKTGFVQKIINNSPTYHQRWLILRSFYLYWFKAPNSTEPKEVTALQIAPLKSNYVQAVRNECVVLENSKGKEVMFVNDSEWVDALTNEIAYKRYMEHNFRQGMAAKPHLVEYFENENCKALDVTNEPALYDSQLPKLLYRSLFFHPKLKELNLSKTELRGNLLQELMDVLIALKKHSKIEALSLDSNGITKDNIGFICKYLESESSFSVKKLSVCDNPIGDEAMQSFAESVAARFDTMNASSKSKSSLPFTELGLSGTRMGDQTLFTMMTFFEQINRVFKERGIEEHKEGMSVKMADNLITDNGMRAFAKVLGKFQALREIDLSNNQRLTNISFRNLLNGLKKNLSVVKLEYTKNEIDPRTLAGLFGHLSDNFLLKRLSLTFDRRLVEAFLGVQEVVMDFYKVNFCSDTERE